jgi:hypothetical protein
MDHNIDYFLFLKKTYTNILSYLKEIINSYDEISRLENNGYSLNNNYSKYANEIEDLKYKINNINHAITELCHHEFIDDEICISENRLDKISYCKICEYTKEYGFYKLT